MKNAVPTKPAKSRTAVRNSGIHGKGVFAVREIKKGERILEYKGQRLTWKEAQRRKPFNPLEPLHTFYFDIDENLVVDGAKNGNSARYINHSCGPNCVAEQVDEGAKARVFIKARTNIRPGAELFYDYALTTGTRMTKALKKDYLCLCGSKNCRGTMLKA
jgi:uncharacterized protein